MGNSILSSDKQAVIKRYAEGAAGGTGEMAEVGVYRGGTALLMAQAAPGKPIHLFDTFTGIPEKGEHDVHAVGDFSDTSEAQVRAFLKEAGFVFHVGNFFETAKEAAYSKFCFVHLDADQYEVTRFALQFFLPRMTKNGVIILDDYGWQRCPGVKKAIDEMRLEVTSEAPCQAILKMEDHRLWLA